ncbi:MAG: hypothetical protein ABSG99_01020 [Sedimentisphaerales bacterium]
MRYAGPPPKNCEGRQVGETGEEKLTTNPFGFAQDKFTRISTNETNREKSDYAGNFDVVKE